MERKNIKQAVVGISFGLTSAIITTLGTIVGLYSASESQYILISGILALAIADSSSDALGIHLSEESENVHTTKEIWVSTASTFVTKFFFTLTFVIPVLVLPLRLAIYIDIIYGIFMLSILSLVMAKSQKVKVLPVVAEHNFIAFIAIIAAAEVGVIVSALMKI